MLEDDKFMTQNELKRLSRSDLLEMLIEQSEELQALREKYAAAEAALAQREITLNKAGSIAEAALQLNGVFEAAQASAQQYIDNVQALAQRQEAESAQREKESREKAGRLLIQTEQRCAQMESDAKIRCAEMTAKAKAEAQTYWDEVSQKLDAYYDQHAGLREMLSVIPSKQNQG